MSGHSKWANIKHRKARMDAQKGKIFTKLAKEIMVAAKQGGGDPDANFRLATAVQKAKGANMPNDNIERAIKKGAGELAGVDYEEVIYEGYGPEGTAIMCSILTDNRNRTAGEIRRIFTHRGGNLGETGCVAWIFEQKGIITVDLEEHPQDEEDLLLTAIEAGAEDVKTEDSIVEISTDVADFQTVKNALEEKGFILSLAEISMLPKNTVEIDTADKARKMLAIMDELEDHEDVQEVYSNFNIPEEIMEQVEAEE